MYGLEIFSTLLFLSFIVSGVFFAILFVHSLVEERKQETAGQVKPAGQVRSAEPKTPHVRPPAQVPTPQLETSLTADLAND